VATIWRFLLLLALLAPGPRLQALWRSPGVALVSWQAAQPTCLSVLHATGQGVFIGRYENGVRVMLGGAGTDGSLRPTVGDVYQLDNCAGLVLARAPLQSVVYFPVLRGA